MALIAVIDDDHDILDASSLVLSAKGYEVITADNPDDGYKIVKNKKPDLIILDVMMNEPDYYVHISIKSVGTRVCSR
jgi:DNA-binding response OmpR family regulator